MPDLHVLEAEPIGEDVVAKLEEALTKAKAGEISSVAIAIVHRDGSTNYSWSKAPSMSLLIGCTARLQAGLIRRLEE